MITTPRTIGIVGAGLAGAHAAQALRESGFDGRLLLIGAENERPYERPPLSKEFLRGEVALDTVYVHPADFYDLADIELRIAERVQAVDARNRELHLSSGERVAFDRLLLATGSRARRLRLPGAELEGVVVLRTLADSEALRRRLDRGGRLVVVGAGWIGTEVAASARQRGLDVTVIDPLAVPLERVLGPEVGAVYRDVHQDHGVRMLLGTGVTGFEGARDVEGVRLADGRSVPCDTVVMGVGAVPRTELARDAGIALGGGVLVDEHLETSVPGIFAAGDIAEQQHPLLGRVRVEHWATAIHQGETAARAMLGADAAYDRLPYFYSDQYDVGMEYTGLADPADTVVFRGDPRTREFLAFWVRDGRVTAGMNVNVWHVTTPIQALIRSGESVDVDRLADPDVPLADLLTSENVELSAAG